MAATAPYQIKIIHVLKGVLGMDEDSYRAMLSGYGAASSKDLAFSTAQALMDKMEDIAVKAGKWQKRSVNNRLSRINRPGYATYGQMAKILHLWFDVSRQPDEESKRSALNKFLEHHFGISFLDWLPQEMVGKVIKTIETMKTQMALKEGA